MFPRATAVEGEREKERVSGGACATLEVPSVASGRWSGSAKSEGGVVWTWGVGQSAEPGHTQAADGMEGGGLEVSEGEESPGAS